MDIIKVGINSIHDSSFYVDRPDGFNCYLLLLVKSQAIFYFDDKEIEIQPNTAVLYPPNCPHKYQSLDGPYMNDWMHINANESIIQNIGIPLNCPIQFTDIDGLYSLMRIINSEFYFDNPKKDLILYHCLYVLLMKLSNKPSTNSQYENFHKLRDNIYNNPMNSWNVPTMASQLHISSGYFQKMYKQIFQISCTSDIIQSRIRYAKDLLDNTNMTSKQIAYTCGYHNDVHFMRQFKKFTGLTPKEYRLKENIR